MGLPISVPVFPSSYISGSQTLNSIKKSDTFIKSEKSWVSSSKGPSLIQWV